jgi:predicted MFS family arabinose efflux permease
MLAVVAMGWFLSLGVRLVYPVLLPQLRAAYDLDFTTAGLLLTVLWLSYALGHLPSGVLADRLGEGRILAVSCVATAGTVLLVVLGGTVSGLFLGTASLGLATALYGVAMFTILRDLFPANVGSATGVTLAVGDAGSTVLPPTAAFVGALMSWQLGFGILVPAFAAVALACWVILPSATSGSSSSVDKLTLATVRNVLAGLNHPAIRRGTILLILGNSIWQGFTGFYPVYLVEMKGLSQTTAGAVFGGFFALGIAIKPVAGAAYDRFGIRQTLLVVTVLMALPLAAIPFVSGLLPVIGVTALASAILGFGTVVLSYVTTALPEVARSTSLGVVRTTYITVAAGSPVFVGLLADRGFFDEAFLVLAGLAVLLAIIGISAPER